MSNMISMSDDVSLVGQELLTLPQDLSYHPHPPSPLLFRRLDLSNCIDVGLFVKDFVNHCLYFCLFSFANGI